MLDVDVLLQTVYRNRYDIEEGWQRQTADRVRPLTEVSP